MKVHLERQQACIRRVPISPAALCDLLKTGSAWFVSSGLPEDSLVYSYSIDPRDGNIVLMVESESFGLVEWGSDVMTHLVEVEVDDTVDVSISQSGIAVKVDS